MALFKNLIRPLAVALLPAALAAGQPVMPTPPAGVNTSRQDGFEFSTINSPGNAPWPGTRQDIFAGRGSVGYSYRISRLEVTTDQWMEFVNAFGPLGDPYGLRFVRASGFRVDVSYPGPGYQVEYQPGVTNPGMQPVIGISWHKAALYCNWLTNNKRVALDALTDGAYNTATWGRDPNTNVILDSVTHEETARYWIPTLDEWLKAVYFDPNRDGSGQSGWWNFTNRSDVAPIVGVSGTGQTSGGLQVVAPFGLVPLLSYPDQMSPWGLFDTSGGASEATEEPLFPGQFFDRNFMGSNETSSIATGYERIGSYGAGEVFGGLRVATLVPSPACAGLLATGIGVIGAKRSRQAA